MLEFPCNRVLSLVVGHRAIQQSLNYKAFIETNSVTYVCVILKVMEGFEFAHIKPPFYEPVV